MIEPRASHLAPLRPIALAASSLLRCLIERPALLDVTDVELAGRAGTTAANAAAVSRLLKHWGWVVEGNQSNRLAASPTALRSLADRLIGMADADELDAGPPSVEPVVTLPANGLLAKALNGRLNVHATRDGFAHVAANATRRLTFLVPFIDQQGAGVLRDLLANTPAAAKTVFVRPDHRGVYWHQKYAAELRPTGVRFLAYFVENDAKKWEETFHAKLALADDDLAYVGSSNFMSTSLVHSLEAGVLLRGDQVKPWVDLIDTLEVVCRDRVM